MLKKTVTIMTTLGIISAGTYLYFTNPRVPQITNVRVSEITSNSANITWHTDQISTSKVYYYWNNNANNNYVENTNFVFDHNIELTNLLSGTQYRYIVNSRNQSGYDGLYGLLENETNFTTLEIEPIEEIEEIICNNGDANKDNIVNQLDYIAVRDNFGKFQNYGDANCDNIINTEDYISIRDNFGIQY